MQCNNPGLRRPYNPSRLLQRVCMWYQLLLWVSGCECPPHPRQWIESSQGGQVYPWDAPAVPRLSVRTLYWHNPQDRAKLIVVVSITISLIVYLPPNPIISNECMTTNVRQQHHHHHHQHVANSRPLRYDSLILRRVLVHIATRFIKTSSSSSAKKPSKSGR